MLHYSIEVKQDAVRLVVEENLTYADVAANAIVRGSL
jgi:transposase-like protein